MLRVTCALIVGDPPLTAAASAGHTRPAALRISLLRAMVSGLRGRMVAVSRASKNSSDSAHAERASPSFHGQLGLGCPYPCFQNLDRWSCCISLLSLECLGIGFAT